MSDTTLHCPGCGYPEHTTLADACEYCRNTLGRIDALTAARDSMGNLWASAIARAEKAEAEAARLREALQANVFALQHVAVETGIDLDESTVTFTAMPSGRIVAVKSLTEIAAQGRAALKGGAA